jgi:transposase
MSLYQHVSAVGVDSHKDTLAVAGVDGASAVVFTCEVPNTTGGMNDVIGRVDRAVVWGIEGTGGYGRGLCDRLIGDGRLVVEVPTRITGRYRAQAGHAKTDKGDSVAVAQAVLRDRCAGVTHESVPEALRVLVRQRETLVHGQTAGINRVRARLVELDPDVEKTLKRIRGITMYTRLSQWPSETTGDPWRAALVSVIRIDGANCATRLRQIQALEKTITEIMPKAGLALQETVGIGLVGAATIIANTRGIDRFPTEGHYGRYCGTAPLDVSSGRQEHHRLNRFGNRDINTVLQTAILTQLRLNGEGAVYINRRMTEGKTKNEAIRAAKRHLSKRVYRTLKRNNLT